MPNKKAAEKALRQTRGRTIANARVKKNIHELFQKFRIAVKEGKTDEVNELRIKLQQTAAKAAKRHVIHANKARRRISKAYTITTSA